MVILVCTSTLYNNSILCFIYTKEDPFPFFSYQCTQWVTFQRHSFQCVTHCTSHCISSYFLIVSNYMNDRVSDQMFETSITRALPCIIQNVTSLQYHQRFILPLGNSSIMRSDENVQNQLNTVSTTLMLQECDCKKHGWQCRKRCYLSQASRHTQVKNSKQIWDGGKER